MSQQRVHVPDASLPSAGFPRAEFPGFCGTIKALRLPAGLPAALRFLRLAVPRERAPFAPAAVARGRRRAWGWSPGIPFRVLLPWRRQDLPSSWGTPIPVCTCSSTPAGRRVPDRGRTLAWPPLRERRRRRRRESFEAQWHGFRADGLRITMLVARHRARLASGRWSGVSGQAFTRKVPTKGFQLTSCALASFSKLLGTIPGIPGIPRESPGIPAERSAAGRCPRHRSCCRPWACRW